MIKRFFKGKPYSLMLARQDENGDPFTWTVNVSFKERTKDGSVVFRSMGDSNSYMVHSDNSVYYTDGCSNNRCHCANIVQGWQF